MMKLWVVFQESLPTYSKYFPYHVKMTIRESDSIGGIQMYIKFPNIDRLEIIGVHRVWLDNMNQFGHYFQL